MGEYKGSDSVSSQKSTMPSVDSEWVKKKQNFGHSKSTIRLIGDLMEPESSSSRGGGNSYPDGRKEEIISSSRSDSPDRRISKIELADRQSSKDLEDTRSSWVKLQDALRVYSTPMVRPSMMTKFVEINNLKRLLRETIFEDELGIIPGIAVTPVSRVNSLFATRDSIVTERQKSDEMLTTLVTHRDVPTEAIDMLLDCCQIKYVDSTDTWAMQKDKIAKADAILLTGNNVNLDQEILSYTGAGVLKVVATMNHTFEKMDVLKLKTKSVRIGTSRQVVVDTAAELAIGLALAVAYGFKSDYQRNETDVAADVDHDFMLTRELMMSVCGIIGQKDMVNAIATKLDKFRVEKIVYTNPGNHSQKTIGKIIDKAINDNVKKVTFDELIEISDFIFVVCPLFGDTHNLFTKKVFKKMKPTSILIDVSSKGVVKTQDLLKALQKNKILGAGVDVTLPEVLPKHHPIFSLTNCIVTPRITSATKVTRLRMAKLAAKNILGGLRNDRMPGEVCFKSTSSLEFDITAPYKSVARYSLGLKSDLITHIPHTH